MILAHLAWNKKSYVVPLPAHIYPVVSGVAVQLASVLQRDAGRAGWRPGPSDWQTVRPGWPASRDWVWPGRTPSCCRAGNLHAESQRNPLNIILVQATSWDILSWHSRIYNISNGHHLRFGFGQGGHHHVTEQGSDPQRVTEICGEKVVSTFKYV